MVNRFRQTVKLEVRSDGNSGDKEARQAEENYAKAKAQTE